MTKVKKEYVSGVCNIGPAETRARLYAGWIGLVATAVLWCLLFALRASGWWGLVLFLPAAGAAVGFLQAALHFCAAFGMRGVFNFGSKVGDVTNVRQEEFRRADRAKAVRIMVYSGLIGAAAAALGVISLLFLNA
jgi:fatty acid desaturase